jgi:hypothetical protein
MSEPRHAMIYKDGFKGQWWLQIVADVWDHLSFDEDENTEEDYVKCDLSHNASTFGPFESPEKAQDFADENLQNTGFEIPILDPKVFAFIAPPYLITGAPDEDYWLLDYNEEEVD